MLSWLKQYLPPSRRAFYQEVVRERVAMEQERTAISNNATAISNNAAAISNNKTAILNNATAILNNETAILRIEKKLNAMFCHPLIFEKYRNMYTGRDIVLCGAGPTLSYYKPHRDAVFVALNRAFLLKSVRFDYIICNDFRGVSYIQNELAEYEPDHCVKFFAHQENLESEFPESFVRRCHAHRYYTDILTRADGSRTCSANYSHFALDLCCEPLGNFWTSALPALQFILFMNPRRIYLAGIDMAGGHFDDDREGGPVDDRSKAYAEKESRREFLRQWKEFKKFAAIHYPEIEIISVNPVLLKGMFQDEYTDAYLEAVQSGRFKSPDLQEKEEDK